MTGDSWRAKDVGRHGCSGPLCASATHFGSDVFDKMGHYLTLTPKPYTRRRRHHKRRHKRKGGYRKGSPSKTRPEHEDFATHFGSDVFDKMGHYLALTPKPYTRRRRHHKRRSRRR